MGAVIAELSAQLGTTAVLLGDAIPQRNRQDCANLPPARPLALLCPRSTEEVAAILRICHRHGQPVAVQGGMTGLAGGAHPSGDEIALSLERMVGVEEVDMAAATLTVLAGTPLSLVQDAASAAGLICGVDLGARGSCTIGGIIATNAGGNQVLRYGATRRNLLGLEAVLADGTVISHLNTMMKDNTGYDWPQLLAGSEGTLGIVTRAVIALHPAPARIATMMLALDGFDDALALLRRVQAALPGRLLAFEAMGRDFVSAAAAIGIAAPFPDPAEVVLLLEADIGSGCEGETLLQDVVATAIEEGEVRDAVPAQSQAQAQRFWALREATAQYRSHGYRVRGLDISIPLASMAQAIALLGRASTERLPGLQVFWFGHVADSNIHVCGLLTDPDDPRGGVLDEIVYGCVARFGGSISAEHGIGRIKRNRLSLSRSEAELALMRHLKDALDPRGILNPGRIFPEASARQRRTAESAAGTKA